MNGFTDESASRRAFLRKTGVLLTGAAMILPAVQPAQAKPQEKARKGKEVSPPK